MIKLIEKILGCFHSWVVAEKKPEITWINYETGEIIKISYTGKFCKKCGKVEMYAE